LGTKKSKNYQNIPKKKLELKGAARFNCYAKDENPQINTPIPIPVVDNIPAISLQELVCASPDNNPRATITTMAKPVLIIIFALVFPRIPINGTNIESLPATTELAS
jgi:hypothetical protein